MTGGKIVILGPTGRNIGAGMTGGIAFVLDEENNLEKKVNTEIVSIYKIHNKRQEIILNEIISDYFENTGSFKASSILQNWNISTKLFKIIVPPSEEDLLEIKNPNRR
tara:strand:- start:527 stop:850 length:324 start_codon:yes stop_codon:yes gene_type:complete